jgi:F-type H+-transporting ATPase subunit epsilon
MEVQPDKITVLASAAETAIQIDPIRAQKAYDRAKKRIEEFNSAPSKHQDIDMDRAHLALERAAARLKAVSGKR